MLLINAELNKIRNPFILRICLITETGNKTTIPSPLNTRISPDPTVRKITPVSNLKTFDNIFLSSRIDLCILLPQTLYIFKQSANLRTLNVHNTQVSATRSDAVLNLSIKYPSPNRRNPIKISRVIYLKLRIKQNPHARSRRAQSSTRTYTAIEIKSIASECRASVRDLFRYRRRNSILFGKITRVTSSYKCKQQRSRKALIKFLFSNHTARRIKRRSELETDWRKHILELSSKPQQPRFPLMGYSLSGPALPSVSPLLAVKQTADRPIFIRKVKFVSRASYVYSRRYIFLTFHMSSRIAHAEKFLSQRSAPPRYCCKKGWRAVFSSRDFCKCLILKFIAPPAAIFSVDKRFS